MSIFKNIKVWAMNKDGNKIYLAKDKKSGYYKSEDGEVSVKITTEKKDKLVAVFVEAAKSRGRFYYEYAVGFATEEIDGLKRYTSNNLSQMIFWCSTAFGTDLKKVPVRTQGFMYEKKDGKYSLILPVCDRVYKGTLFGDEDGINVALSSYYSNLTTVEKTLACVYVDGEDSPFNMVHDCANYATKLMGTNIPTRENRRYPEIFEYLGWCSWDSMQINVSEDGLLEKCREFKEKNIPVKWAILDDMWADCRGLNKRPFKNEMFEQMHSSALSSFEADRERFPQGLKHCITEMKKYGLKIGMWHPTTGYWYGIDPESDLAREYADCFTTILNGKLVPKMESDKLFKFYNGFHRFLRECGADFVKIDNQSILRQQYTNVYPVGVAARAMHEGIEASAGLNFDNNIINCMCMAAENMWNRPTSAVCRTSGDFLPENREWFIKHITQCMYGDMFQGEFYYNDFDMWWTDDGQAEKNSLLRSISGGPIYVSDKIGRSNKEILDPLAFDDGRILRCDTPAKVALDSLFDDPQETKTAFKIFNTCQKGRAGVIAVYNLTNKNIRAKGRISPADIIGLAGEEFAVYEYFTGKVRFLKKNEEFTFNLKDHDDYRLYIVAPFDKNGIAMLGRLDKYMSPCAVVDSFETSYSIYEGGKIAFVNKGRKSFVAVSESGVHKIERKGSLCEFELKREDKHFILK